MREKEPITSARIIDKYLDHAKSAINAQKDSTVPRTTSQAHFRVVRRLDNLHKRLFGDYVGMIIFEGLMHIREREVSPTGGQQ